MDSVCSECADLKQNYETCFNKWFAEKFLKNSSEMDKKCDELFIKYKACVKVFILLITFIYTSIIPTLPLH